MRNPSSPSRPNVVLIIADDTTPGFHGCYGGPTPTPNIDRLAREGLRMQQGYCCASLCSPSRYTLFTGQYVQRSKGVTDAQSADQPALISQNGELQDGQLTLPRLLRKAGYFTAHFGKWHTRFETESLGFPEPDLPQGDADDPEFDQRLRLCQARAQEVVKRCAGFEIADRICWGNIDAKKQIDPRLYAHNPAWLTDGALEFLDEALQNPERPFYLHVANSVPHGPDSHLSLGMDHRYTWGGKLEKAPCSHPDDASVLERMRDANLPMQGLLAGVNAGQIMLDDQIGAILGKLESAGQLDNTLFIYTADHGLPGKGSCHVMGQHLPLVMRWKEGFGAPRVVAEPFSWVHLVPTIAHACKVEIPDEMALDGQSLLPALRGESVWPADVAYHEMGWSRSVIKGRYQYIATRYPDEAIEKMRAGDTGVVGTGLFFDQLNAPFLPHYFEPDQLYDLQLDPTQQNNLAGDKTRKAILEDLQNELFQITERLPCVFPREPDPFVSGKIYAEFVKIRKAEMAKIRHYPTKAKHIPTVIHGNYDDPDLS